MEEIYHKPVLLNACIDGLNINPEGIYVDVTFGGGGHSKEILKHLTKGKLIGFDQDKDAVENILDDERFIFVNHNFKFISNFLRYLNVPKVDGIIADLGVSSHHFDKAERGFSFRQDATLDMRMNQNSELTAARIINQYSEGQLMNIFKEYGEIENAFKLSKLIIQKRSENEIKTTFDLVKAVEKCTPKHSEYKYFSKVFQALRIEVNQEIQALRTFLLQTPNLLNEKGRLVILTYHSLEDRDVKNFMKKGKFEGELEKDFYGNSLSPFELIYNKVIVPSLEEIEGNNRARSAKLRIAERKSGK